MITYNYPVSKIQLDGDWSTTSSRRNINISDGKSRDKFIESLLSSYNREDLCPDMEYINDLLSSAILQDNNQVANQIITWFDPEVITIKATDLQLTSSKTLLKISELYASGYINCVNLSLDHQGDEILRIEVDLPPNDLWNIRLRGTKFFRWIIRHADHEYIDNLLFDNISRTIPKYDGVLLEEIANIMGYPDYCMEGYDSD